MFPGNGVKNVSPMSSNINHTVLKRKLTQWIHVKSFTNVGLTVRTPRASASLGMSQSVVGVPSLATRGHSL